MGIYVEGDHMETLYSPPSRFKISPYGHLVRVIKDTNKSGDAVNVDYYIQVSKKENEMEWVEFSKYCAIVFYKDLSNKSFIDSTLVKYQTHIEEIKEIKGEK